MYPHRIRLRGPWDCEPLGAGAPPARRVFMPCRWLAAGLADFHGQAIFARKFGYPGNADPASEHIWLTCDGVTGCTHVSLNGQSLTDAPGDAFAYDITHLLSTRNRLEVTIQGANETEGIWGDVALEIRKDAYLTDIKLEPLGDILHLHGNVVGTSPQPLEIYVLVDGRNLAYQTIAPNPSGQLFHIELAEIPSLAQSVRVDLIHVSTIWYVVELPIPHWNRS